METTLDSPKPIHTILLDTAPILLNTPPISTLLSNSETLIVTPAVVSEIKGEEARNRFDTLYRPFVTIRTPKAESIKFVKDFARRTGDLAVLSAADLEVLALAYDLECERNGGDWRLRSVPGQKRVNGQQPQKESISSSKEGDSPAAETKASEDAEISQEVQQLSLKSSIADQVDDKSPKTNEDVPPTNDSQTTAAREDETQATSSSRFDATEETLEEVEEDGEIESGSEEGWITPSNIKRHQINDETNAKEQQPSQGKVLQVATMTGDFAMQNVLLQMNLNLLSTKTCKRVGHIKQTIFRCHACFATTKEMTKQFCPRCGKPTLTRVTCTTNDKGEVKLHLKSNFQWNNRGNVYSVPKPVSGSANQKWQGAKHGGGKGGWGTDLILAEDQKEYVRAVSKSQRRKEKDLMDEDILPSILSGSRDSNVGRIKVGAGRNVNRTKR